MILIGEKLAAICRPVLGADWKTELAQRLGCTRQTIHAKSKSKTGLPKAFKRQLLAVLEDQMATIAASVNELRQDVGPP
jgi:hypothetical protein